MTATTTLRDDDLATLEQELSGRLVRPGTADFDAQVTGFNAAVVHRPDLVVQVADAEDVRTALRFAAVHQLPVAVQATGHGAVAPIEAGILLRTDLMSEVRIDVERGTATVGAGARWRDVIPAAAAHGLAPLNGSSSGVGVVGYTLGGGLPVMGRTFGFAADRVRSLDVVTADGELHTVTPDREPELFWGLCGGQGNLGIVTSIVVELVPVTAVYGGGLFFGAEHIAAALHAYRAWCADLPEAMSSSVAILRLPPAPEIPEPLRGRTVAHVRICHVGAPEDGERLVAPLRSAAPVLADTVGVLPYERIDTVHQDPDHPVPVCQRGALLAELPEAAIDALLATAGPEVQAPLVVCEIRQLGGAFSRRPPQGNAVGGRDAAFSLVAIGLMTPDTAAPATAAVDRVIAALQPWSTGGTVVNLHGTLGDEADRARAWDPETYERLLELSRRLDPSGLLRSGHAIGRIATGARTGS